MFYINNNPILTSDLDVLQELKSQLEINGIKRFAEFKKGTENIQFNCPIHGNGQEQKPSCGVTTINKNGIPAGTVHCFACGYTATLEQMISHCFGISDLGQFGREWLVKNFLTVSIENRKEIIFDVKREQKTEIKEFVDEKELEKYRYYHPYMYQRKLTNEIIEKFDIGYDDNFKNLKCLTFPIRDISGNVLFIARRSVDTKIFNYPVGVEKPIYGLYELNPNTEELIVCEGLLDALTCNVYGKQAVSFLGLGTKSQIEQLKKLKCRKIITAFDSDSAGFNATEKLKKALKGYKIVTTYDIPNGKDINDLTKSEFDNLQEIF